jgi:Predicted nucleic acid-binding protein, contains PIN domain
MNGRLLLDTNFLIGYLGEKEHLLNFLNRDYPHAATYASVVSKLELLSYHALSEEDEAEIESFLSNIAIVPLDEEVQKATVMFRRATRKKLPDSIVAASAITVGATLVTCDRELAAASFPGLKTINPDDFQ